ncbi:hypothetical protein B0H15DRAFT_854935 [Mycena belliarum]|uniref:Uncharacterized protein n=1 Tax=Mycena belliarum TaxID=1033014 RepID=A0AAD6TW30_9AGAR|nr:hypothetical protein B0H15DRAFT_854935 [Mycena belliae]
MTRTTRCPWNEPLDWSAGTIPCLVQAQDAARPCKTLHTGAVRVHPIEVVAPSCRLRGHARMLPPYASSSRSSHPCRLLGHACTPPTYFSVSRLSHPCRLRSYPFLLRLLHFMPPHTRPLPPFPPSFLPLRACTSRARRHCRCASSHAEPPKAMQRTPHTPASTSDRVSPALCLASKTLQPRPVFYRCCRLVLAPPKMVLPAGC